MKRLITTALPYVNNVPHLGNLIQGLSGDVFARYSRSCGDDTLYICGTDEYGTATETRAREEGVSPKELCDRYYTIHDAVYRWFEFSFDIFGRTSHPIHTEITQDIFTRVYQNGYIVPRTTKQLYSEKSKMFLADRYVIGSCPKCGYEHARGDQCEHCGTLLDPAELINVRSVIDGSTPVERETRHLYLNLPKLSPLLQQWLDDSRAEERWVRNAMQMTRAWIRDGLRERAITRDLSWGIPVPLDEYRKKVFYVWFDACIGYISITAQLTDRWRDWWQNPTDTRLYQFVGKDNIPFHTVIFPSSLLATGEQWTMLHHISSTEYLNYEGGQFSKSKQIGVFGTDAMQSGIPADVWRFYLLYNRPENSDYTFTWDDFYARTNKELIGNFANFFNRLTTFIYRNYDGTLPALSTTSDLPTATLSDTDTEIHVEKCAADMRNMIATVGSALERLEIRDALREVLKISDLGNKLFQDHEPWKHITASPRAVVRIVRFLALIAQNLSILIAPFLPQTARKCCALLGISADLCWKDITETPCALNITEPRVLFARFTAKEIARYKKMFEGKDSAQKSPVAPQEKAPVVSAKEQFLERVRLIAAKIVSVATHHNADTLFIEQVDDGRTPARQIVSGLVAHYRAEELIGKTIILVDNLKPIKIRGVVSDGMLLAAHSATTDELELLEVDAPPGTQIVLEDSAFVREYSSLKAAHFFNIPIVVTDHQVCVDGFSLICDTRPVRTTKIATGTVA